MSAHVISAIGGDVPDHAKVTRALLSVSDKTGLVELARARIGVNVDLATATRSQAHARCGRGSMASTIKWRARSSGEHGRMGSG